MEGGQRIDEAKRVRCINLANAMERAFLSEAHRGRDIIARPVARKDEHVISPGRTEVRGRSVRKVMIDESDLFTSEPQVKQREKAGPVAQSPMNPLDGCRPKEPAGRPARSVEVLEMPNQSVSIHRLAKIMTRDRHLVDVTDVRTGLIHDLGDRQDGKPRDILGAVQPFLLNGILDGTIAGESRCCVVAIMNAKDPHRSYVRVCTAIASDCCLCVRSPRRMPASNHAMRRKQSLILAAIRYGRF